MMYSVLLVVLLFHFSSNPQLVLWITFDCQLRGIVPPPVM